MNKIVNNMLLFVLLCSFSVVCFGWSGGSDCANECDIKCNDNRKKYCNRGFVQEQKEGIVKKFPMCDEFLRVEWIDKENRVGFSEYDIFHFGKHAGSVVSIVTLKDYGAFTFKLNLYDPISKASEKPYLYNERKNSISKDYPYYRPNYREVKDYIKDLINEFSGLSDVEKYPFPIGKTLENGKPYFNSSIQYKYTLSDNENNICIVFPNKERVWFAEFRINEKQYSKNEIIEAFKKVEDIFMPSVYARSRDSAFKYFSKRPIIDLNNDGVNDYYWDSNTVYSNNGNYKRMDGIGCETVLNHPYANYHGLQLTTDGKDYYLYNDCNLTEKLN